MTALDEALLLLPWRERGRSGTYEGTRESVHPRTAARKQRDGGVQQQPW